MRPVLVTGASGFIGREVLGPLVAAGHDVHAVSRSEQPARDGVTWHAADLIESAQVVREVRPEILVHLAWYAEPGNFWTSTENLRWVEASLALLRTFVDADGRRAVIAGTCAEYDWSQADGALREDSTLLRPSTLYGAAKKGLHEVAEAFSAQAGLELAWGRIFFLYGSDEPRGRLFASVARALLAGEPARTTAGEQVRDFLHVSDVGAAFASLAISEVTGAVNVGSGDGVALRDLVAEIGLAAGRPELLNVGALPPREGEPPRLVADTRRLHDEVGFAPSLSLQEGIAVSVHELRSASGDEAAPD